MNVLITGGTGYIGSHTAVELLNAGHTVVIMDDLSNSKITVLDKIENITGKRPQFILGDCTNRTAVAEVFNKCNIEAVIHMAGYKAVGESVEQPLKYYQNNLVSTLNILYEMKAHNVTKFLFSSSATVYGDPGVEGYTENLTTGINLTNPYGKTKYMIEEILKDVAFSDPNMEVTLLRYFNPIGAHKSGLLGEDPNGIPNNLMPVIMRVSQGKIPELQVFGDDYATRDGSCLRDYIHVVDLAQGHLAALNAMKPGTNIYNLGTGNGTSVLEMVRLFEEISQKPLPHKIVGRRPGDLPVVYANPAKAERELNWKTKLTVRDAIEDTLRFLANQASQEKSSDQEPVDGSQNTNTTSPSLSPSSTLSPSSSATSNTTESSLNTTSSSSSSTNTSSQPSLPPPPPVIPPPTTPSSTSPSSPSAPSSPSSSPDTTNPSTAQTTGASDPSQNDQNKQDDDAKIDNGDERKEGEEGVKEQADPPPTQKEPSPEAPANAGDMDDDVPPKKSAKKVLWAAIAFFATIGFFGYRYMRRKRKSTSNLNRGRILH